MYINSDPSKKQYNAAYGYSVRRDHSCGAPCGLCGDHHAERFANHPIGTKDDLLSSPPPTGGRGLEADRNCFFYADDCNLAAGLWVAHRL
jgi:hypothetical protein